MRRILIACLATVVMTGLASAGDRPAERELIYGSELMTDRELDRYRAEVGKLKSDQERERYRERHRERLRERARTRGVELDEPAGVLRRGESR